MRIEKTLEAYEKNFEIIPEFDNRTKIKPREFIIALIFSLSNMDQSKRTLDTIRRSIMSALSIKLSRGGFWERLATQRLFNFLLSLVACAIQQMNELYFPCCNLKELANTLKIKGILVLDSTSITLPEMAGAVYPGPRNNVAPAVIKWHHCYNLFGGVIKWFDLSPGTSHDQNHFPDLKQIIGYLIIFDLGYYDYCLMQAIDNVGGFFLCRLKSNATCVIGIFS